MTEAGQLGDAVAESRERIGMSEGTRFDLGVLFVHGIGEHARGDTLTEAGDALAEWLHRRFEPTGEVTVLDVFLRQASPDSTPAAHAVVRIRPDRKSTQEVLWLIAEGWWADVFRPASYSETAVWGLSIGPWVLATQVYAIVQRTQVPEGLPILMRVALLPIVLLTAFGTFLAASVVALATSVLALGLTVLALLPLPVVPALARRAQGTLAAGVGDAFVLTRSPVRFTAMASQVRSDLRDLRSETKAVAVVAHSQGTAVAWAAVKREFLEPDSPGAARQPDVSDVGLFLTYGQAVRKLTFMLTVARGQVRIGRGMAAATAIAVLHVAIIGLLLFGLWQIAVLLLLGATAVQLVVLRAARDVDREARVTIERHWDKVRSAQKKIRWLDLWASADAVPGGPLEVSGDRIRSYKIRNVGSPVDHVNYWQNRSEYLAIVGAALGEIGGLPQLNGPGGEQAARLTVAAMRRHTRVMILIAARFVVLGAAAAGAIAAWRSIGFGDAVLDVARRLPLVESLLVDPDDWLVRGAGSLSVLVVAGVGWLLAQAVWAALIARDDATYFRGGRGALWQPMPWLAALLAPPLIIALVAAGLILLGHAALGIIYVVTMAVLVPLALVVLSAGGTTVGEAEQMLPSVDSASGIASGRIGPGIVFTIGAALLTVPALLAWLGSDLLVPALVIEAALISAVLTIEGIREYVVFVRTYRVRVADISSMETISETLRG
jgi:hypothetical protein